MTAKVHFFPGGNADTLRISRTKTTAPRSEESRPVIITTQLIPTLAANIARGSSNSSGLSARLYSGERAHQG